MIVRSNVLSDASWSTRPVVVVGPRHVEVAVVAVDVVGSQRARAPNCRADAAGVLDVVRRSQIDRRSAGRRRAASDCRWSAGSAGRSGRASARSPLADSNQRTPGGWHLAVGGGRPPVGVDVRPAVEVLPGLRSCRPPTRIGDAVGTGADVLREAGRHRPVARPRRIPDDAEPRAERAVLGDQLAAPDSSPSFLSQRTPRFAVRRSVTRQLSLKNSDMRPEIRALAQDRRSGSTE